MQASANCGPSRSIFKADTQAEQPRIRFYTRPTHGEGISFNRFGLHAIELEAFEMGLIILLEIIGEMWFHYVHLHEYVKNPGIARSEK